MVSVIVPVYNVKEQLEKCVRSILSQTERSIELILVDDGSTDGSGELCDSLAMEDGRIKAVHQENAGLGGARNTGVEAADGEWLMFIDSDDWIEPECVKTALAAAKAHGADMAVFRFRSVDENGNVLHVFTEDMPLGVPIRLRYKKDLLLATPSACNKLYKASLFRDSGIRYPSRVWYEDLRTTPKLMTVCGKAVFTDYVGYNYLQREGSIMRSSDVERNKEIIDAIRDLVNWFKANRRFDEYRDELTFLAVSNVYLQASVRVIKTAGRHPLLTEFYRFTHDNFPDFKKNPYLSRLNLKQRLTLSLLELRCYGLLGLIFKNKD